jgi:hypothetical protein
LPLEVDDFFGSTKALYAITLNDTMLTRSGGIVEVPVGNVTHLTFVDATTAVVILICFAYITAISWTSARHLAAASHSHRIKAE